MPANANSSGIGYRKRARRPNAQQQNGSVTGPRMTMYLNATPYGRNVSRATIIRAGISM